MVRGNMLGTTDGEGNPQRPSGERATERTPGAAPR
jgi:hypothetical protein